jgi:hypothetical protein
MSDYDLTRLMNFLIEAEIEYNLEWNPFADINIPTFPEDIDCILWQEGYEDRTRVLGVSLKNGHYAYIDIDEETNTAEVTPDTDRESLEQFMPASIRPYRPTGDEPEDNGFDLADEV